MLKDHSIYLRMSTYHDLVHDATHILLLDMLDRWNRGAFEHFQDIGVRGRPRPITAQLLMEQLHERVGQGIHQELRFKVWRSQGAPVRSLEFHAGAHPYTGVFHTRIDVRVERQWFERNPQSAPRVFKRRFKDIAALIHPFQGHAHDTDDNSIQNIDSPALLRRGFGLEVEGPIDLENNPGREIARGQFTYVINWLTLFGPGLLGEHFEAQQVSATPGVAVERLSIDPEARKRPAELVAERMGAAPTDDAHSQWLMLSLGDSPLESAQPENRTAQLKAREHLGFAALADSQRYMLGYWQRKR